MNLCFIARHISCSYRICGIYPQNIMQAEPALWISIGKARAGGAIQAQAPKYQRKGFGILTIKPESLTWEDENP